MIKIIAVEKMYKQGLKPVHAVNKVDLTVEKGERVYIHGPSGAGKSTLLHIIGGLDKPSKGKVLFNEKNIYRFSDRKRSRLRNSTFGFIFQFYHLLPELNVFENVMLPALMKGRRSGRKIKEEALNLLETVKLKERLKHRPSQLSGGEAQRTAIARALINEPELLLCDEPAGNLDSEMSSQIYSLLSDISEDRKMSIIVVSHQEVHKDFFHSEYTMKDGVLFKRWNPESANDGETTNTGAKYNE